MKLRNGRWCGAVSPYPLTPSPRKEGKGNQTNKPCQYAPLLYGEGEPRDTATRKNLSEFPNCLWIHREVIARPIACEILAINARHGDDVSIRLYLHCREESIGHKDRNVFPLRFVVARIHHIFPGQATAGRDKIAARIR